jgi:hypothetical protein
MCWHAAVAGDSRRCRDHPQPNGGGAKAESETKVKNVKNPCL